MLDIGARNAPYKAQIPHDAYLTLDVVEANEPGICCDVHEMTCASESFDTIIAAEVLEHLYDPQRAADELHRVLRPGGVCILSTVFLYHYHPDPKDYYRYRPDALTYLLRRFSRVEVYPHGNRLQAIWDLFAGSKRTLGLASWLNPLVARIGRPSARCPVGFVVWAEK